jgi:hypothetical protein
VVAGVLLGGGLVYLLDHGLLQSGVSQAARALGQIVRTAGPAAAARPAPAASAAETPTAPQEAPGPALSAPAPQAASAAAVPQPAGRDAASAQRTPQQLDEQKERAWARYYTRPAQCDGEQGRDTIVECANHYIRARREFEAAYAAGKR